LALTLQLKDTDLLIGVKDKDPTCLKEIHLTGKSTHQLKVKERKTICLPSGNWKGTGVAILKSDKIGFKPKLARSDKEGH
jgi:hypothetical protein